jgi:hypothetical protein
MLVQLNLGGSVVDIALVAGRAGSFGLDHIALVAEAAAA